ncbi:geranylgeranyl pyrophosphate synthetase [Aspergillus alliaceus]|uniref:Geranylgeranyl pyrophosphate synthetase n=1 Tax=Petromyces alliaceus TaxID=209559 RepID=A0A5N6G6P1_PETAA|nr:isoprenoid synthase domain-containing protein [Aspergillus alliaceus]KAB8237417.1 isoprenoid synthase domain-containing protein [Aspergillus alliaceus]KAE8390976.1 isoprenoid synthase domain-containing protein [Aspergillus alliaceus]KAF5863798.1 geranylgeranyl pyrophosphate synthetase [Aspergillus burnettii]
MSSESSSIQPPTAIHPRTSSTGATDGASATSSVTENSNLVAVPEVGRFESNGDQLQTNTNLLRKHTRNRSSVDGTKYRDGQWSPENERIVLGPYDYMLQHPGKDIRRQLINAFNVWLKVPPESLATITKVVAMLHTASLLIDDVEDCSILRRGVPVAHNIYGTAQTINSANYVYFLALQEVQKLNNPAAIEIFARELLNLHRGQGMDLFWRDTLTCPSEEEYLEMVGNKTGGLFRLAVKLMQAESDTGKDCVTLVNVLGLIFQICDDYLNLSSTTYTENKGLCEDLTEGKFSFPIIHSIRSDPSNHQLINILKQKTKDDEVKLYAVKYMEGTGSFAHTQEVVRDLREKALALIDEIDANENGRESEGYDGVTIRAILDKITESTLKDDRRATK